MMNNFNLSYRQQYQLAMGAILLAICLNWILVQWQLWQQSHDAQIINRAGRQRMFSQKITKLALQIQYQPQTAPQIRHQLRQLQKEWRINAAFLQKAARQNRFQATRRAQLIRKNYPHFKAIDQALTQLLAQPSASSNALAKIQEHEVNYLQNSEALAFAFQSAAEAHLRQTQTVLGGLSLCSLIIVILAIWKIFYRLTLRCSNAIC
ncbi:MAG: hypothetical protein HC913_20480 [Microscillaceae bacterium]|nr:hypothetical protein [Microscillaceae bacterium]